MLVDGYFGLFIRSIFDARSLEVMKMRLKQALVLNAKKSAFGLFKYRQSLVIKRSYGVMVRAVAS